MILIVQAVLHYFELINLQLEHNVLHLLLQNAVAFVSLDNTHLSGQDKMRLISQLITGISRVFEILVRYFNDTIISTSFVPPLVVLPVCFCLSLNKALLLAAWTLAIASASVKAGSCL